MNLTPRQEEICELIGHGYSNKAIAGKLGISVRRVAQLITRIAQILRLDPNRSIRIQIAQRSGKAA